MHRSTVKAGVAAGLLLLLALGAVPLLPSPVLAADKIQVEKLDDLPRHTYTISGKASELLTDDAAFLEFAAKVKADILEVLDTYAIDDATTLQGYYGTLQSIAFLENDYDAVFDYIEKSRELEDKEATRLMMGRTANALIATHREMPGKMGTEAFSDAFRKRLETEIADLPWDVVQDLAQQVAGQMQIVSENLIVGMIQGGMDPAVESSGFVSGDQAAQLINVKSAMVNVIPVKDTIASVYGDYIAANEVEKEDIWAARNLAFTGSEGYSPVVVAVWDAGVDPDVFTGRMYTNSREILDGEDNDGNGYVDDRYGIAYDVYHDKTPEMLYTLGDAAGRRDAMEANIKGFMDLQAGIESDEAAAVRERVSGLEPAEVKGYLEEMNLYAHHSHGTHVAGIAIEGNPYAQVLGARLSFDHRMIPIPYTMELSKKWAVEFQEVVDYFRANDVRVVNMSWGMDVKELEATLEQNGIGEDAEDRGAMAREMFAVIRDGLGKAFASAPDICFIAAAGNSDNDISFDEFIPSGFAMENLLTVGAVDQAGQATGFTSFGETVKVYANGFEVESFVPGGNRIAMSGTSMASPNAANLAAKLLAMDPSLTPPQVYALMRDGADDMGEDRTMMVLNPTRSVELLLDRMGKKSE